MLDAHERALRALRWGTATMPQPDLRRQLELLAQQFIDGVIRAIQQAPLAEVSAVRSTTARTAGGARRGRTGFALSHGERAPRRLVRRASDEIERLRTAILATLRGANAPLSAHEIARRIGGSVRTSEITFPMNKLREARIVRKEGERTLAVYSLVEGPSARAGKKSRRGR
jgi:DNA-binding transcriptional ArsR family regulator